MNKIIRPAGFIFFSVILILIIVFNLFFLDNFVKKSLINIGEGIFKAKFEIKKVDIKLLESKIEISGLSIADKDNEFKNLFSADKIIFDFEFIALLKKKIIIDDIQITGFATGTKREKSGKLPEKRLKEIEKKDKKTKKENKFLEDIKQKAEDKVKNEMKNIPVVKTINSAVSLKDKKIADIIKKEDLESYKVIIKSKESFEQNKNILIEKRNEINIEKRINEIKTKADGLKNIKVSGLQDVPVAQEKIKELDNMKSEINLIKKQVQDIKNESEGLITRVNCLKNDIKAAKEKDNQLIMSKLNFDILNAKDIESAIIGPVWKSRIDKILQIIKLVDKYIPEGKKAKKKGYTEIKRMNGTDVKFISDTPSFWIKKVKISKSDKSDGIGNSGQITDLCFEPYLINKPCIIDLSGTKNKKLLRTLIKINRIDSINDYYLLEAKGSSAGDFGLDNINYGNVKFESAMVNSIVEIKVKENLIKINGKINILNPKFKAEDTNDMVYTVISSLENININIEVISSDSGLSFNINSDILNSLDKALKKIYGKKIEEAKDNLNKQIENLIKSENGEFNKITKRGIEEVKEKLNVSDNEIKNVDVYIDNIKDELLKKIKDSQKESTDGVIKGLFR